METFGINIKSKSLGRSIVEGWDAYRFKITLTRGDKRMTTDYAMGIGHSKNGETPTPDFKDVMQSLCSDARSADCSFDDFCGEFGYDTDSIKALNIYKACKRSRAKLQAFLGDDFDTVTSHDFENEEE